MRQFQIGSAFGIPIKLDLTFLLILPFFAWIIGTAAALGLFAGVVLHELGHSVVAMRFGFPIDSITLWIFGGIAKLTDMPEDWKQELAIAIAGPIVSVALGIGFAGAYLLVPTSLPAVQFVIGYLAAMNVALAAFNLLPAFPMDGGRVLRALLARTRPFARATKLAADVGKLFAILLGILGLLGPNILLIGIAFFVYIGAANEAQQTAMKAAFEGVTVRDLMTPAEEVESVSPKTTVAELIERMFEERHTGYPVTENGELVGLVTLSDAQSVRPIERDAFHVEEVMTRDLVTIDAGADAMTALTEMDGEDVGRLLVSAKGTFVGLVTRSDLMTAFNIIQSSGSLPDSAMAGEGRAVETAPEEFRFER